MTQPQNSFLKYPSLENTYQTKFIDKFTTQYHELLDKTEYIVTEKLHGANASIILTPYKPPQLAKRTSLLNPDEYETFYNINLIFEDPDFDALITIAQQVVNYKQASMHFYFEWFGPRVQKGVDYGLKKQARIFDMRENGILQTPQHTIITLKSYGLEHLYAPILVRTLYLDKVLEFDVENFITKLGPETINTKSGPQPNIAEGIVIRPYHQNYYSPVGELFALKKKSEAYKEKHREKTTIKPQKDENPEIQAINSVFLTYLTPNRIQNIFSKHGPIQEPKQIPTYIAALLQDAKEDFIKEHNPPLETFTKAEQRQIFNAGSTPFTLIKPHL